MEEMMIPIRLLPQTCLLDSKGRVVPGFAEITLLVNSTWNEELLYHSKTNHSFLSQLQKKKEKRECSIVVLDSSTLRFLPLYRSERGAKKERVVHCLLNLGRRLVFCRRWGLRISASGYFCFGRGPWWLQEKKICLITSPRVRDRKSAVCGWKKNGNSIQRRQVPEGPISRHAQ